MLANDSHFISTCLTQKELLHDQALFNMLCRQYVCVYKLVLPMPNYGLQVWGLNDCKKLLGVRQQTHNNYVYRELGRTSLTIGRVINVIKYWLKVVQLDDIKYGYNVMCRDLAIVPNSASLANSVRHLLQSIGFNNVWMNQGVGNVNLFIRILKERLNDNVVQN